MGKIDASAFLQQQQQGSAEEQDTDSQRQNIRVGKLGEFELLRETPGIKPRYGVKKTVLCNVRAVKLISAFNARH